QPHVVGKADPELKAGSEREPLRARLLISAQLTAQPARLEGAFRRAKLVERAAQPRSRGDLRPFRDVGRRRSVLRRAREKAHRRAQRKLALAGGLPVAKDALELFAIELDPSAADQHQPALRLPQLAPPVAAQTLAVHRSAHCD